MKQYREMHVIENERRSKQGNSMMKKLRRIKKIMIKVSMKTK